MLLTAGEIEKILGNKLLGVPKEKIHEAAQAIIDAHGIWDEIDVKSNIGAEYSCQCKDICEIGSAFDKGLNIRVFVSKV